MTVLLFSLLIGVIAGLRVMTAPVVVSWAAYLGAIDVGSAFRSDRPALIVWAVR